MNRRQVLALGAAAAGGLVLARSSRPRPLNQGLRFAVLTARLIDRAGLDRVVSVALEDSHVCFAVAGAVAATLRQLGREAWMLEGGEGLDADLDAVHPDTLYLAYFGGLPDEVVQAGLDADLARLVARGGEETVVLHWPTVTRGYFENALFSVEGALDWAEERTIYAALNEGSRAVFKRLVDPLALTFEEVDALPMEDWPPLT